MRRLHETLAWYAPTSGNQFFHSILFFCLLLNTISLTGNNPNSILLKSENGESISICLDCENATDGGTIEADETGCPSPIFDPAIITSVTLPSGGSGNLEYVWIFTENDPTAPLAQWTPIPNTNTPDYDPDPITMTTYYRRCARREGCIEYVAESNIVKKEIVCCDNLTNGGEVCCDQEGCGPTYDPAEILNTTLPSGGSGNMEFVWYVSTMDIPFDLNNPNWFEIPATNAPSFNPGPILQTSWFVRLSRREGCEEYFVSNIIKITVHPSPELTAMQTADILCMGDTTANVDLTITGGTAPFEIFWDSGIGAIEDPINLGAGTYAVTVSDSNSCFQILSIDINNPDSLLLQMSASTITCFGGNDGTATVSVSGGMTDYTFLWSDPMNQTTATASNLTSDTYTVTVTDANGCTAVDSIFVTSNPELMIMIEGGDMICTGSNDGQAKVNILSGGFGVITYQWDDPAMTMEPVVVGLSAGVYHVTVTDELGCQAVDSVTVIQGEPLEVTLFKTDVTCFDGNDGIIAIDSISGGMQPFTFQWDDINNSNNDIVQNVPAGTYHVTVTDQLGCMAIDSITVENGALVEVIAVAAPTSCLGMQDGGASVLQVTGGMPDYTFLWSDLDMQMTQIATNLTPGTYTVMATDANGCIGIDTVLVESGPDLDITTAVSDVSCLGGNDGFAAVIDVPNGTSDFSILWSNLATTDTISNLIAGTYDIMVIDANGCIGVDSVVIAESAINLEIITATSDVSCLGGNDGFAAIVNVLNSTPDFSILWSNLATTDTIFNLTAGTYEITVMDGNGCTGIDSVLIAAGSELKLDMTSTDAICGGDENGAAKVTVSGGVAPYEFQWDDTAMQTTPVAGNLGAGNYTVTVTDANGCSETGTVSINAPAAIEIVVEANMITCPGGNNGNATVTILNANPNDFLIQWDDPNNSTTDIIENLSAGIYHVKVIDSTGCSVMDSVEVTAPDSLISNIFGTGTSCFDTMDGAATVEITGGTPGYAVQWDDPTMSNNATVNNLGTGIYNVTVTDAAGCTETASVEVTSPSPISISFDIVDESCNGNGNGSISTNVVGGTSTYFFAWSDPTFGDTGFVSNLSAGSYTVTVTDAKGCTAENIAIIGIDSDLTIQALGDDVSCNGNSNGFAYAVVNGGVAPFDFSWQNFPFTNNDTLTNLSAGTYGVTVTDAEGCAMNATAVVNEPSVVTVSIAGTNVACSDDASGQAIATVLGGTAPYFYEWDDPNATIGETLNGILPGTYHLTVTDFNGCEVFGNVTIEATTDLSATSSVTDATCFGGMDGTATANGINGTPPYTIQWSIGQTGTSISNLFTGMYTATITDSDGCTVTQQVVVGEAEEIFCQATVSSNISSFGSADGAATVEAIGGTGGFTFLWENGDTSTTIDSLAADEYFVTVTDENGCTCVASADVPNPAKLGNFVWKDLNENGVQEVNEPGLENIQIVLTGSTANGAPVNLTTFTDVNGMYYFDGILPGFYKLTFELLQNYIFTPDNIGNNAIDSDVDPNTGMTPMFPLAAGTFDDTWDVGMIQLDEKVNIGNYVWRDGNRNGIQDSTEVGVQNVSVRLVEATTLQVVQSTSTNVLGLYEFPEVLPGQYYIEFLKATLPTGFTFTESNVGNNDEIDSDADTLSGRTPNFIVQPFAMDDFSYDAGVFQKCDNVTAGGAILGNETLCGIGADPNIMTNSVLPSGGFGTLEYLWLQSNVPIYNGPGDPNWTIIPGINTPFYDPGPITQSTYYIRCARRECCIDYIGESNIIAKELIQYPLTNIEQAPNSLCINEEATFEASNAGGGAQYFWEFGDQATPAVSNLRVVPNVSWSIIGTKTVTLTVTRFGCSFSTSKIIQVLDCLSNPSSDLELQAEVVGEIAKLSWQSPNDDAGTIFLLQRTDNGEDFETIGSLKGDGGIEHTDYQFLDEQPLLGTSYYRVQKVNAQGQITLSSLAEIFFQPASIPDIHFYPNPFNDRITLHVLEPTEEIIYVQVVNGFAQILLTFEVLPHTEQTELNLGDLPEGIYSLFLQQNGKREVVKRIFKAGK